MSRYSGTFGLIQVGGDGGPVYTMQGDLAIRYIGEEIAMPSVKFIDGRSKEEDVVPGSAEDPLAYVCSVRVRAPGDISLLCAFTLVQLMDTISGPFQERESVALDLAKKSALRLFAKKNLDIDLYKLKYEVSWIAPDSVEVKHVPSSTRG